MLSNIYNLFFSRLFVFKGRSNRKEYIARTLLYNVTAFICVYNIDAYDNADPLFSLLYVVSLGVYVVLFYLSQIPLDVRRLHDINASGWWVLLIFSPFGLFLILVLIFKKGTAGVNEYGDQLLN